jgi:hypothetical protein
MTTVYYNMKIYVSALCAEIMLFATPSIETLDEGLKRASICAGIIVAALTAIKIYSDIVNSRLDRKIKRLDLKKKEERE